MTARAVKETSLKIQRAGSDQILAAHGRITQDGVDVTHGAILYLEDITVSFDGFRALNKLSLSIDVGELRCIIGPNGAGKTTMMDVITGKTRPDLGTAFFGQSIDPSTARRSGRCRQHLDPLIIADGLDVHAAELG